jgi:hypothetical protein
LSTFFVWFPWEKLCITCLHNIACFVSIFFVSFNRLVNFYMYDMSTSLIQCLMNGSKPFFFLMLSVSYWLTFSVSYVHHSSSVIMFIDFMFWIMFCLRVHKISGSTSKPQIYPDLVLETPDIYNGFVTGYMQMVVVIAFFNLVL